MSTIKQLFEARVHFGHRTRYKEPKMAPYIYGVRYGVSIINLDMTIDFLNAALDFVSKIAERPGSKILFVGTKRSAQQAIKQEAIRCNMPYVDHRWRGGTLTNYRNIRQSVKRYKDLISKSQDGSFDQLTKKEALNLQRQKDKLERDIGGIKDMGGLPDALFIIDVGYEYIAVTEAKKLKIPIVGIVDTNHSQAGIDYMIPGNDDATTAIELYARLFADTILAAREHHADRELAIARDSLSAESISTDVSAEQE